MGASAPCRIVYMTCEALKLDYKIIMCDLQKGENKSPDYLKMNPQHTIPTLNDNGLFLNESRGIATYLAAKYGKDDKLYPQDLKTRAIVDQRLYFDMGVFYKAFGDIVVNVLSLAFNIHSLFKNIDYKQTFRAA